MRGNSHVRFLGEGITVMQFSYPTISLATNEVYKEETQTEWHRVVIFGKGAEVIQQYCKKGDALYVEGRIRTNKW